MFPLGGADEDGQPSSDINRYNPATNEWEPAGYMHSCRYSVIVSPVFKNNKITNIIVIDGDFCKSKDSKAAYVLQSCRITEICEVGVIS